MKWLVSLLDRRRRWASFALTAVCLLYAASPSAAGDPPAASAWAWAGGGDAAAGPAPPKHADCQCGAACGCNPCRCAAPAAKGAAVKWLTDELAASDLAHRDGLPVLILFTADEGCPWCDKLKAGPLADPAVLADLAAGVVLLKVDAGKRPDLLRLYGVEKLPTVVTYGPGALYPRVRPAAGITAADLRAEVADARVRRSEPPAAVAAQPPPPQPAYYRPAPAYYYQPQPAYYRPAASCSS